MIKIQKKEKKIENMNILNLPEFEVLDTIQDDHDMEILESDKF